MCVEGLLLESSMQYLLVMQACDVCFVRGSTCTTDFTLVLPK